MNADTLKLFNRWFMLRFPQQALGRDYYQDWVKRFNYAEFMGQAIPIDMDGQSEALWWQVIRQNYDYPVPADEYKFPVSKEELEQNILRCASCNTVGKHELRPSTLLPLGHGLHRLNCEETHGS